ncbi:hypothetical protein BDV96DRAFT_594292 [Lophiotrema nucula]|uniref:Uncharacterized protein n=1 Tax=Lophiotrema nucula TaxID=690887 RepID=A0A6A5ZTK2_9PLEO|nr:hypothetical protein BDV96DRAFT_594292 [Lophiotrema nucula]
MKRSLIALNVRSNSERSRKANGRFCTYSPVKSHRRPRVSKQRVAVGTARPENELRNRVEMKMSLFSASDSAQAQTLSRLRDRATKTSSPIILTRQMKLHNQASSMSSHNFFALPVYFERFTHPQSTLAFGQQDEDIHLEDNNSRDCGIRVPFQTLPEYCHANCREPETDIATLTDHILPPGYEQQCSCRLDVHELRILVRLPHEATTSEALQVFKRALLAIKIALQCLEHQYKAVTLLLTYNLMMIRAASYYRSMKVFKPISMAEAGFTMRVVDMEVSIKETTAQAAILRAAVDAQIQNGRLLVDKLRSTVQTLSTDEC